MIAFQEKTAPVHSVYLLDIVNNNFLEYLKCHS